MLLKTILLALVISASSLPVDVSHSLKDEKKTSLISVKTPSEVPPWNEHAKLPDLAEFIEVKEEDIPDGTLVLEVDEPVMHHVKLQGESMQTADNVVFRPLFRYREKQSLRRRIDANKRYRRRYYVPRRSYRPYRSAPYHYYSPYRFH